MGKYFHCFNDSPPAFTPYFFYPLFQVLLGVDALVPIMVAHFLYLIAKKRNDLAMFPF